MIAGASLIYTKVASAWISQAYRPSTKRQHDYVSRLYTGLADRLQMDYLHPSQELAASFTVFLACNFKTQKSVMSLLSSLISLLDRAGLSTSEFRTQQLRTLNRSISINKRAPTLQRPPIDTTILRRVIDMWRTSGPHTLPLIAAVLLMFTTSVRQSNLLPTSQCLFDGSRQLIWADIEWRSSYIRINIKWGKSQQKACSRYQKIPLAASADLCLYSTLRSLHDLNHPRPSSPVIAFRDRRPIPINYMRKKWAQATMALGIQGRGFTLHSLRRGGARFLQDSGVTVNGIAHHVGWKSSAMFDYVNDPAYRQTQNALSALR